MSAAGTYVPDSPPHCSAKGAPWLCPPGRVSQDAQQAPSKSPLLVYWGHLAEGHPPHNTTAFITSAIGGRQDGQWWACLHTRVGGETGLLGDSHIWTASYTTWGLPPSPTCTRGPPTRSSPGPARPGPSGPVRPHLHQTADNDSPQDRQPNQMEEQRKSPRLLLSDRIGAKTSINFQMF